MMRHLFPILATAFLLSACGGSPPAPSDASPPADPPFVRADGERKGIEGVVMIVVDTLRADHLGVYGSDRGLTPRIDALAGSSYLFERAVAASSWTRPSVAAMLTSRYPTSMGVLDKSDILAEEALVLPEILRDQAGFETLGVFANGNVAPEFGFDQGFDEYVPSHLHRLYEGEDPIPVAPGVTHEALALLDQRDRRRPFFLFVHYVDPHDPYLPHPELAQAPDPPGRFDGSRTQLDQLERLHWNRGTRPADLDRVRHLYAGEVAYADQWVGRLLDGLAERGLTDRTMVILTSDHGEGLWSHGRRGHGNDLYEESVHVPLLVKYPGMKAGDGRRIGSPVSLVDLPPTILAAVGAPKPPAFQGFDLRPLTRGESRDPTSDYVYTEMDHRGRSFEAVRYGDWKLIRNRNPGEGSPSPSVQIFDLQSDPHERGNLADRAQLEIRRDLAEALRRWSLAVLGDAAPRSDQSLADLGDATLQNLRALGYLGKADLEKARAPRNGGEPTAPTVRGSPRASSVRIDLTSTGAHHRQLLHGFVSGADGSVWITGEASAVLARREAFDTWTIGLRIDPGEMELPLEIEARPRGGEGSRLEIDAAGFYVVDGSLPRTAALSPVRLDIECRHLDENRPVDRSIPRPSTPEPCVRVTGLSLR